MKNKLNNVTNVPNQLIKKVGLDGLSTSNIIDNVSGTVTITGSSTVTLGLPTSGGILALTSNIPTSATFLANYDNRYVNVNDYTNQATQILSVSGQNISQASQIANISGNVTKTSDPFYIRAPASAIYTIESKVYVGRNITALNGVKTTSGVASVSISNNGTPVTFTGSVTLISANSVATDYNIIDGGTVSEGNRLTLVINGISTPAPNDLEGTIIGARI
jgi:hypothetical protein